MNQEVENRKRSSNAQMTKLVDLIEEWVKEVENKFSNTKWIDASSVTQAKWIQFTKKLNDMGPPEREWRGWRRVWNDLTNEARRKIRKGDKGGLNRLQNRAYMLQGRMNDLRQKRNNLSVDRRNRRDRHSENEDQQSNDHLSDTNHVNPDPLRMEEDSIVFKQSPGHEGSIDEAGDFNTEHQPQSSWTGNTDPAFNSAEVTTNDICHKALISIEDCNRTYRESIESVKNIVELGIAEMLAIQRERLEIEKKTLKLKEEKLKLMRMEMERREGSSNGRFRR